MQLFVYRHSMKLMWVNRAHNLLTNHVSFSFADVDEGGFPSGFSLPPFLAAGLTFSLVLLGIVAYFSYRWLVQRLQATPKPATERTDPEQPSSSSSGHQPPTHPTDCSRLPSIEEKDDTLPIDEATEPPKSPSGKQNFPRCFDPILAH
ncbi:uncharacterized protein CDAR_41261 [Caerostris darwini]|uniref:Uncharacterized protein n=1 Tax=Caerostris darwini TaxID=1538125 RepID=A0AAV4SNG1_9ARAC|nr:uncharacterized protein CDAR_41261 [Caerostris darwini]